MIFVFYILAAVLIYLSFKSLRGGIDYLNYSRSELARPWSNFAPFATIVAPCKGLEDGLEENLVALFEQEYPSFEVIFVVDDSEDGSIAVIEKVAGKDIKTKLVVAPKATESSQKVENLREAVLHANEQSEVFVFVDSDARPSKYWLRSLVAPLEDVTIGATTGYRWFISRRPTFASELRNIWNASIASALGPDTKDNFCWGGSTAIRRETFERLDVREKWRGTLSDDLTVTRVIKDAGMKVKFVPQALTPSIGNCTFSEMLEFTTRQMRVTRVYAQRFWVMSFLGSGLFCIVMTTAFLVAALSPRNGIEVFAAIATLLLVTILSVGKSWLRLMAARLILTEYDVELRKQALPQLTLWLISPFVFLYNCVAALFSRRMVWRGTEYKMISSNQTLIIKPGISK